MASELRVQVHGYRVTPPRLDSTATQLALEQGKEVHLEDTVSGDYLAIGADLLRVLRGHSNLVFANRKRDVQSFADLLRQHSEREHLPNEFFPHHGSLVKELREDLEVRLKEGDRPTTAVCTTTLEMGIHIGAVASVAQIGAPPSVAGLRQRLGRSGRRGEPAVLRLYVQEEQLTPDSPLPDLLRVELVQAVAIIRLLARRWYEPPNSARLHLSTLSSKSPHLSHNGVVSRHLPLGRRCAKVGPLCR